MTDEGVEEFLALVLRRGVRCPLLDCIHNDRAAAESSPTAVAEGKGKPGWRYRSQPPRVW